MKNSKLKIKKTGVGRRARLGHFAFCILHF